MRRLAAISCGGSEGIYIDGTSPFWFLKGSAQFRVAFNLSGLLFAKNLTRTWPSPIQPGYILFIIIIFL